MHKLVHGWGSSRPALMGVDQARLAGGGWWEVGCWPGGRGAPVGGQLVGVAAGGWGGQLAITV